MDTGSTLKPSLHKLRRITVIALGLALLLAVLAAPLAVSLDWQVAWAPRALAAGTLIDDFTDCAQEVTVDLSNPITTTTETPCNATVLGGARTVKLERTGILPFASSKLKSSFGFLQFSNEGGGSSDATITWDENGFGLGSGNGIDLSLDPGMNLTVYSSDLGVQVTVRLTDMDGNGSELTKTFGQTVAPGAPFFVDFDLLVGSADLTKITKIELVLIGGDSSDSILSLVELIEPEVDFGDLPDGPDFTSFSYGALLVNNGPRHVIDTNLLLGKGDDAKIDAELDGQPTLGADGDDLNGLIPDDEQGVPFFPLIVQPNGEYLVTVDYVNTTGSDATIVGWIDFDQSGTFEVDERATIVAPSVGGATGSSVVLPFIVPVEDRGNDSDFFARIRIASDPNEIQLPTGLAKIGEVEDYRTNIDIPLAVTLGYFMAEREGEAVSFTWETATETGNAGFNLHMAVDGNQVLVNPEMIASSVIDSVTPTRYTYETQSAQAGASEDFYIETFNISGSSQRHGPFALGNKYGTAAAAPTTPGMTDYPLFLPVIVGR